ncbi:MAG: hypothetical protein HFJ17_03010 [Clostridia bacterium]|nr:hypothetical protein [Clostridia bacterium]
MKNRLKENKGITLIALVITIIVLLILAGVAISMLSGDNGILRQAAKAKEETEIAGKKEEADLFATELKIAKSLGEDVEKKIKDNNFDIINDSINNEKTIYITERRYAIENKDTHKKYIVDENLDIIEATEVINILQKVVAATKNDESLIYTMKGILGDQQNNDSIINNLIGNEYDNTKYRFAIFYTRLVCYLDSSVSREYREICEKAGIYLWGDVNGDFVVNNEDSEFLRNNSLKINSLDSNNRQKIASNVHYHGSTKTVNDADVMDLEYWAKERSYDKYSDEVDKIYAEYQTALNDKLKQGINKTEFDARTEEEIKKYISYDSNNWKFKIIRGELFVIPYDTISEEKVGACKRKKIYLLGDITDDNKVTTQDMSYLELILDTEGNLLDSWSDTELLVADVDGNGKINADDIPVLQSMIDGTYE